MTGMATITCTAAVSAELLARVQSLLAQYPALAEPAGFDGTCRRLSTPVPPGWKLGMNQNADTVRMTMNESGHLFDLSEVCARSSGGWLGTCMPASRVERFLRHWCERAPVSGQGEFF